MRLKVQTRLFALVLFLFIPAAHASAQKCLAYDTDAMPLTGTISKKTFPGPPNYESIKKGDKPETYWILHLDKAICTTAGGDSAAESNVTDLQLILSARDYARYKHLVGQESPVLVIGKLTHAITGHHHTPVLIEVKEMIKAFGVAAKP